MEKRPCACVGVPGPCSSRRFTDSAPLYKPRIFASRARIWHSSLRALTPDQEYFSRLPEALAAERATTKAVEAPVSWEARKAMELLSALPTRP